MVKNALSVAENTVLILQRSKRNTVLVIVFSWKLTSRTEIQLIMQIGICACFAGHVIWRLDVGGAVVLGGICVLCV
jgi:hypothetical protein